MDEKITSNSIQDTNKEEITILLENSSTIIGTEGNFTIKNVIYSPKLLTRKKERRN